LSPQKKKAVASGKVIEEKKGNTLELKINKTSSDLAKGGRATLAPSVNMIKDISLDYTRPTL
jgi:WD40 repeat protein